MSVTPFGLVVILIAMALLSTRPLLDMLVLVIVCSLMAGTAALFLTAVGNASVQPVSLALAFLVLRFILSRSAFNQQLNTALTQNIFLIIFCLYGATTAFILPKIFQGQISVVTMRPMPANTIFDTSPLQFSPQNITASVYLLGTLFASVIATAIALNPKSGDNIVKTAVAISWIHVGLGVLGVALKTVGASWVLDVFRNATYAQLSQDVQGVVRINGIFPETSSYCTYAFTWLIFVTELWLRDVRPRMTGTAAIALTLVLAASTSSTAYVSLGVYAVVLVLRWIVLPRGLGLKKSVQLAGMGLVLGAGLLTFLALAPRFAQNMADIIGQMTAGKLASSSGQQRSYWAMQGVKAFGVSGGLGIGAGSFRSSSLLTAIWGSMGIVGAGAFIGHLASVLKPWRLSTFGRAGSVGAALAIAAGWTACLSLVPAAIDAPGPDPGILFGIFSGLALGWRISADRARRQSAAPAQTSFGMDGTAQPQPSQ